MKTILKNFLLVSISLGLLTACSKEDEKDKGPTGPVYTTLASYESILLGSQTNLTYNSFYSTTEDSIYHRDTAALLINQPKIDLIYYFLGSIPLDSCTIASPTDPIFGLPNDQTPHPTVKTWANKNDTRFLKLNINPSTFMNMVNDSLLINDLDSNVTATKVNNLKIGDVVGFKTKAGKFGAYHVKGITNATGTTRTITIDVKVQE